MKNPFPKEWKLVGICFLAAFSALLLTPYLLESLRAMQLSAIVLVLAATLLYSALRLFQKINQLKKAVETA